MCPNGKMVSAHTVQYVDTTCRSTQLENYSLELFAFHSPPPSLLPPPKKSIVVWPGAHPAKNTWHTPTPGKANSLSFKWY